jgi:DNA transformation protein and related proteins
VSEFKDFVLLQLDRLPAVSARAMFGGWGFYSGGVFFAIAWKDQLYFRTSPDTAGEYLARDMPMFRPFPNVQESSYYQVPPDVLASGVRLAEWAAEAVAVAAAARPARKRGRKRTR